MFGVETIRAEDDFDGNAWYTAVDVLDDDYAPEPDMNIIHYDEQDALADAAARIADMVDNPDEYDLGSRGGII